MKKCNFILTLLALLLTSRALAYYDATTTSNACTGFTTQVVTDSTYQIGKSDISVKDIVGIWGDAVGVAAYSSEETLNAAGGTSTTNAIANGINEVMSRMSVRNGSVEFTSEGRIVVTSTYGESAEGTYEISGATIAVLVDGTTFLINAKVEGNTLQLFYPVEKMPQQILRFFTDYSTEGLYLGVQLNKK